MSLENEGLPVSWDEIKAASRRILGREPEQEADKRAAREYLAHTDCEDMGVTEHIAVPGYN